VFKGLNTVAVGDTNADKKIRKAPLENNFQITIRFRESGCILESKRTRRTHIPGEKMAGDCATLETHAANGRVCVISMK
jgi:hypothetical protein